MTVDFFDRLAEFLSQDPDDNRTDLENFVRALDDEGRETFRREISAITASLRRDD